MTEQHRPEVLFSSLLELEVKTQTILLNAEDKKKFAQILDQIKDAIASGYKPDETQKSILNQLTSNDSPKDLLELTAETLRNMPKTEEKDTFISALKTYQQEAINQAENTSQPEENSTMPENTYKDFANKRKEITNLEKHQRKNSDVDHSAEIISKIEELITMYEGMTSLEDKRKAKDSLRSVVRFVDTETYAELSEKLDTILSDKPLEETVENAQVADQAPTENSDEQTATPTENSDEQTATPTENSDEQTATPTENSDEQTVTPTENSDEQTVDPAEDSDEQTADPAEDSDEQTADPAKIYQDEVIVTIQNTEDETNSFDDITFNTDNTDTLDAGDTYAYSEDEILNLLNSQDIKAYKASLNPKISRKTLEDCYFSKPEDTAAALANPADMLIAYDLEKGNNERISQLNEALVIQLDGLDTNNISPEAAFIWQHLAERIMNSHPHIYIKFVSQLQASLQKYDAEHFQKYNASELSADKLNENYQDATNALKDFEPTSQTTYLDASNKEQIATNDTLGTYTFTDDKGKVLKDSFFKGKKLTETRNAILAQARELAAQELATEKLPQDEEQRKARLNEVMNEKIASILGYPYEKNTFTQSEVAVRLAGAQQVSEDFKTRVTQKFKNTEFAKAVTANVNQIDEKLTKKFGKPYTTAKKFLKLTAKVSWGAAKSAGLFAVAGMASPFGIPALIAYNTVKNWKNIQKQVNNPNISKAKKYGLYIGATVTTALSALGAASGVGAMAGTVGLEGVSTFCQNAGAAMGVASRSVAAAVGATIPNWIEKASLAIQAKKMNLQIKNCCDPQELEELLEKQKELKAKQKLNNTELVEKTLSVAIGSAVGLGIRGGISSYMEANAANTEAQEQQADTQQNKQEQQADAQQNKQDQQADAQQNKQDQQADTQQNKQDQQADTQQNQQEQQAAKNLEAAKAENSGSNGKSSFENAKTVLSYLKSHNPSDRGINPEEVATSLSEHMGDNAGKTAMSCAMAPYALQDVLHLDLPEGQAPTTHNMMTYIAEHGLTPEQQQAFDKFTEQNFDENGRFQVNNSSTTHTHEQPDAVHGRSPSSVNTEKHEAPAETKTQSQTETAPKTRQPEYSHNAVDKVADYMNQQAERTNSGSHYERVDHLPGKEDSPQQPERTETRQPEVDKPQPRHAQQHPVDKLVDDLNQQAERTNSGCHFERVDHIPGIEDKSPQPERTEARQPEVDKPQPRHAQQQPVETYDVTTPAGWAGSRGLILDPYLTQGLNRIGDNGGSGYAGAYIDPENGKVICVPNDPVHDKPYTVDNPRLAREYMNTNTGPWCHSNSGHQNWYGGCADGGPRHLHGSGVITHNNNIGTIITNVHAATHIISDIAHTLRHSR